MLHVEIVYALAQRSVSKALLLPPGASIADALRMVEADEDLRALDLAHAAVGIFGKVASREQRLKDGDRIEIYRPLLEEPKLARRKRASRKARSQTGSY
jgi:putative ubiquitin-RnfH superfamily antitoxin RatB of RatAB toxin-antitoxin module